MFLKKKKKNGYIYQVISIMPTCKKTSWDLGLLQTDTCTINFVLLTPEV